MAKGAERESQWHRRAFADCLKWVKQTVSEHHSYTRSTKLAHTTGTKGVIPMQVGPLEGGEPQIEQGQSGDGDTGEL